MGVKDSNLNKQIQTAVLRLDEPPLIRANLGLNSLFFQIIRWLLFLLSFTCLLKSISIYYDTYDLVKRAA